jgi:long-chain acyl-CoA synthetase
VRASLATIDAMFRDAARRFPDRAFIREVVDGRVHEITYARATQRIAAAVRALREVDVRAGDCVLAISAGQKPLLMISASSACSGAVLVPLAPSTSLPAIRELLERVSAKLILADEKTAKTLRDSGLPVLSFESSSGVHVPQGSALPFEAAIEELESAGRDHGLDDPYMIQPTSGTTGKSKLVIRPHRAFSRVAWIFMPPDAIGEGRPPLRVLSAASLTHGAGQYALAVGIAASGTLCVPSEIDTATPLDEVRVLDPHWIGLVPRMMRSLYEQHVRSGSLAQGRPFFGPSTRWLETGGAKPDAKLLAYYRSCGLRVRQCYGGSEISVAAIGEMLGVEDEVIGAILPDVELRVALDGELHAKTPVMMLGYYGDEEQTRAAFTEDGFYRTGDACEITADNRLRYLGRIRDVLNTFEGSNVYPQFIESVIEHLPWVEQVVLVGDQRPYIAAMIVIEQSAGVRSEDGVVLDSPELYARARTEIGRINAKVEVHERVRRIILLTQRFSPEVYRIVGHGKTFRARAKIIESAAQAMEILYSPSFTAGTVPGSERDLRRHQRVPLHEPVQFRRPPEERARSGETVDVSLSGMCIVTDSPLRVGESSIITFGGVQLSARVVWASERAMGVELDNDQDLAALEALIARHKG